jgi:hypothetical protein
VQLFSCVVFAFFYDCKAPFHVLDAALLINGTGIQSRGMRSPFDFRKVVWDVLALSGVAMSGEVACELSCMSMGGSTTSTLYGSTCLVSQSG